MSTRTVHPRIGLLLLPLALLTASVSMWLAVARSESADASGVPSVRHVAVHLLVPDNGDWWDVEVGLFIYDDGSGDFDAAFEAARDDVLADFPGAIDASHADAGAQYILTGYTWPEGVASWAYNPAGKPPELANDAAAIRAGAEVWGKAGAPFTFTGGGLTTAQMGGCYGASGRDGQNTVGWTDGLSSNVLARTCTWADNGIAYEFDMEFGSCEVRSAGTGACEVARNWTTGFPIDLDLQSVAAHEFGHAAGLRHTSNPSAVMFASYSPGTNKRDLRQDDIDGIIAAYSSPTPTNTPIKVGRLDTPTPSPTAPPSLALYPGSNLIGWSSPDTNPRNAFGAASSMIQVVYGWDRDTESWKRYAPGLPEFVNNLQLLESGKAYWIVATGEAQIPIVE